MYGKDKAKQVHKVTGEYLQVTRVKELVTLSALQHAEPLA